MQCQSFTKNLQLGLPSKTFVISEIFHFTTFLESWFSIVKRGLGNFATVYHTTVSLPRQSFSESLESRLSSEKLAICKSSHFTNFNRNLVYFPCIKDLATLQVLITLNGINMTPAFLKKKYSQFTLKSCILQIFAFYNFSENLDFHSYEEDWATLQLPLISRSIITMPKLHKKLAVRAIFKKNIIAKFHILQLLLESWYSTLTRGLSNIAAVYLLYHGIITTTKLLRKPGAKGLSSERLVIYEILDFKTFLRILIFSPTKRVEQLYSCL